MAPHRGVLILILGIVGLVVCAPAGIAAWIMGKQDLAKMDAGQMDPEGRQMTNIGKILGIIAMVFMVIIIVFVILGFVAGGAAAVNQ